MSITSTTNTPISTVQTSNDTNSSTNSTTSNSTGSSAQAYGLNTNLDPDAISLITGLIHGTVTESAFEAASKLLAGAAPSDPSQNAATIQSAYLSGTSPTTDWGVDEQKEGWSSNPLSLAYFVPNMVDNRASQGWDPVTDSQLLGIQNAVSSPSDWISQTGTSTQAAGWSNKVLSVDYLTNGAVSEAKLPDDASSGLSGLAALLDQGTTIAPRAAGWSNSTLNISDLTNGDLVDAVSSVAANASSGMQAVANALGSTDAWTTSTPTQGWSNSALTISDLTGGSLAASSNTSDLATFLNQGTSVAAPDSGWSDGSATLDYYMKLVNGTTSSSSSGSNTA